MNELVTKEEREDGLVLAKSFIEHVNDDIRDIKRSFFRIGFRLYEANQNEYYKALGYASISDLALAEFGIEKSSCYDLMRIYDRFHDWKQPMQIEAPYENFSRTQLRELCHARYAIDYSKIVKPTDTVEDIKRFVSALNKYYNNWKWRYEFSSIDEVFETFEITRKKQKAAPAPKPEPQLDLIEIAGEAEEPEEEQPGEECTYVENAEEPADADEEFEKELAADYVDGEDYSQHSDECTCVENPDSAVTDYFTDSEVIVYVLKVGTYHSDSKFKIYEKHSEPPTMAEFVSFIKNEYGGGHFIGGNPYYKSVSFDEDTLRITRLSGREIIMPWKYVAGRISRLIESNEYLDSSELAEYTKWKAEQDGLKINVAEPAKPEPIEIGKKTNWEYLQACTSKALFLHLIEKGIESIPEDFGGGMSDRLRKWLQIWLEKPVEL